MSLSKVKITFIKCDISKIQKITLKLKLIKIKIVEA